MDERPIEKLLRLFASHRRQQAGERFQMHPATRRLLQGEVARVLGQPVAAGKRTWFGSLFILPKLLWSGAAVAAVFLFALVIWHTETKQPQLMAQKETQQLAAAPPAEESKLVVDAESYDKRQASLDLKKEQPVRMLVSGNEALASNEPSAIAPFMVAAAPSPSTPVPAPQGATSTLKWGDDQGSNALLAGGLAGGASAAAPGVAQPEALLRMRDSARTVAPAAPAQAAPATALAKDEALARTDLDALAAAPGAVRSNAAHVVASFKDISRSSDSLSEAALGNRRETDATAKVAKTEPLENVLSNFKVEQTGKDFRIIDQDGSIYTGLLQAMAAEPVASVGLRASQTSSQSYQMQRVTPRTKGTGAGVNPQPPTMPTYFFRVAGTNVTLQQPVVFTGNLSPYTTTAPSGPNGGATAAGASWLGSSRVSGRAVVNGRQQIEIQAVPNKN